MPTIYSRMNLSVESLEFVRTFSLSLPVSVSQQLLRTWANAWTTSYRMHETQLLYCIFVCVGCLDTQQHYLICPALWGVLDAIVGKCPFDGFLFHLCIVNCSALSAARLVVASATFHTLRNSSLRVLLRFSVQGELNQIKLLIRRAVLAHLLIFLTTAGVGPSGAWAKRFLPAPPLEASCAAPPC